MNSIIYRTHLGRLLCPKTSLFNYFQGISRFSGKLGRPWDLPCVFPIPLRATVALFPLFGVYDGVILQVGFNPFVNAVFVFGAHLVDFRATGSRDGLGA